MRSYLIRRVLLIIPTFIVVSMIIFLILRLIPGNVIDTIAAQYIYLSNLDKTAIEKSIGIKCSALHSIFPLDGTNIPAWKFREIFCHKSAGNDGYKSQMAGNL